MHARWKGAGIVGVAVAGLAALSLGPTADAAPQPLKYSQLTKTQKRLISGFASTAIDSARGALPSAKVAGSARTLRAASGSSGAPFYYPSAATGCAYRFGSNVNMDQDCQNVTDADLAGRGQAQNETYVSEDKYRAGTLLGSANDYRRGDGGCYGYTSLNDGRSFDDVSIPVSFTRGTAYGAARQYWGGGGDTSSAFDTRGNAYYSCQLFNRGTPTSSNPDLSSALVVLRSTGNGGASYTFPARVVTEEPDVRGTGTAPFLDKQLLTVDDHVRSPYRDRVYVTWTTFAPDGTSYIYESHSADYAETWSKPVLVSGTSAACTSQTERGGEDEGPGGDGDAARRAAAAPLPSTCTFNQFSQPFTGADGALYVTWVNVNNTVTGADNRNQVLLARSTDGGNSFSAPVKVTDYYELPDCATYTGQNAGRACVPDKRDNNSFFRATNYPVGAVDPRNAKHVVVTVGSYVNQHSNERNGCVPAGFSTTTGGNLFTGVKTVGACNNDILVSESRNAGTTFTGTTTDPRRMRTVTTARRQATTDQWFQWADFSRDGRLAVSYYDRQYGNAELTGWSDFSLSASRNIRTFGHVRVTTSSMPPPTQFAGVFWGDYTGLAAYHGVAHPAWSDTRTPEVFTCPGTATTTRAPALCVLPGTNAPYQNDQEAMTARLALPVR